MLKYKRGIIEIVDNKDRVVFKDDQLITTTFMLDKTLKDHIEVRDQGEFALRAIYLPSKYHWEIVTDSDGVICLVPTKKE